MAKLSRDLSSGTLHPRENIAGSGALGALNAEIVRMKKYWISGTCRSEGTSSNGKLLAGSFDNVPCKADATS